MDMHTLGRDGLVLLGCGKMGSAMLQGWLADGFPASSVWVQDPAPSDWVRGTGVQINAALPAAPGLVLIAVKPQMMADALPVLTPMGGGGTLFVSVAAGVTDRALRGYSGRHHADYPRHAQHARRGGTGASPR